MTAFSTDRFISAAATGDGWREVTRKVLESLQQSGETRGMTVGFLYVTDALVDDTANILGLLKSVTGIETWIGSVSLGVCGCGVEYIDEPAISVLCGRIDPADFILIPPVDLNLDPARRVLDGWLDKNEPMLGVVHGDPLIEPDPIRVLAELGRFTGAFLAGGLSSSRGDMIQIAGETGQGGLSGLLFSQNVQVSTALTQGCVPLGPLHTVTRSDRHMIMELDNQRAFDVFIGDLRAAAGQHAAAGASQTVAARAMNIHETGIGLDRLEHLFRGEIHVAFPVPESDQRDYVVRQAIGIDPDEGQIAIAYEVAGGERMMFVQRDDRAMREDLSRTLLELRERVIRERGAFAPKGALYISCLARAMSDFTGSDAGMVGGEMRLVREVLGDVPLAGFYANGEISNHRLYGYTAVVILFH